VTEGVQKVSDGMTVTPQVITALQTASAATAPNGQQ
jgi:hypothetical protein